MWETFWSIFTDGLVLFAFTGALAALMIFALKLSCDEQRFNKIGGRVILGAFALSLILVLGYSVKDQEEEKQMLEDCGCLK